MAKPKVLVLTGYGINCEEETSFAFQTAGAHAEVVHINDLIDRHKKLEEYQILVVPGGFSYGDDTGSGKALANKIRNNLGEETLRFMREDNLVLGICNGFQVLVNLGVLPALDNSYEPQVALTHNDSARYTDRWVDLDFLGISPWIDGIRRISLPVAHGEGRFYAEPKILRRLQQQNLVSVRYAKGEMCDLEGLGYNPNGSLEDIAGITDGSGRVLGMMPHPERAIFFTQLPHWTLLKERCVRKGEKLPSEGPGIQIFKNGVRYFE
ncbi:MAG TPA: phosphoribosylformylglycinamidine synthase subunit PurQ [Candidatus Nanoarchaeia archaeon]|nr:phosphoribosylformylglycinamidine synthase subunit PurQ [Candidatus Nanoarchaeia archaeon]